MARPKAQLPEPGELRALLDINGQLAVRVTPGARTESLEVQEGGLTAKVRAKPEGGKANDAVRELIARALGVAPSKIGLLRGATSRQKLFMIAV